MKKRFIYFFIIFILLLTLMGCRNNKIDDDSSMNIAMETQQELELNSSEKSIVAPYKYEQDLHIIDDNYRTYYEVFLYSFADSDGDGIGDINGLISKLDYINDGDPNTDSDLGCNGIWLMPIMPSSTYHKYDVKDYYSIDKEYGTIEDFKNLVKECEKRGIKLIIDLVLNHSSNEHPWFVSAVNSLKLEPCGEEVCIHDSLCIEHNPYIDYYNFVNGKPNHGSYYYTGVGDWYYEGVFTSNMPDLNLANKNLRREIEDIMYYWLDLGVSGFRLDAALHYYTNDTDKNNEVISWLNDVNKKYNIKNYMVAEVWTNFSNYVKYYESGIDSVFNFAFATENGKIVKTLNYKGRENSGRAFGEAMIQVQEGLKRYSDLAIDAPFFTNHDTARAAGYFMNDPAKIKMAAGMNLMMSGNVFVYYGEEIGMSGSGRDENKRAPFVWTKNGDPIMTLGPKDMETVTHNFGSLEEQMEDPLSIYHYYKRGIRLRNENPEIARGEISIIEDVIDEDICAIKKTYGDNEIILLYNISDEVKEVTISKEVYNYDRIRGYLTVNGEEVILEEENLILPPYSIVILK